MELAADAENEGVEAPEGAGIVELRFVVSVGLPSDRLDGLDNDCEVFAIVSEKLVTDTDCSALPEAGRLEPETSGVERLSKLDEAVVFAVLGEDVDIREEFAGAVVERSTDVVDSGIVLGGVAEAVDKVSPEEGLLVVPLGVLVPDIDTLKLEDES